MRAHPSRLLLTVLLLVSTPLLARGQAAAGPLFDAARLKQYSENDPAKLFDDARVTCALKQLLTPEEYTALTDRMGSIGMGEQDEDKLGAFVFPGAVSGLYTIMEGIVMVEPSGKLWVAYIDDEEVKYFTNVQAFLQQPPKTIEQWRARFEEKPVVAVTAKRGLPQKPLAQVCAVSQPNAEACTAEATRFNVFQPAVVKAGAPGRKVSFFSEPVACQGSAPCPARRKAYLVENDAVALSRDNLAKNGFLCVSYRAAKGGTTVGWMPAAELSQDVLPVPKGAKYPGAKAAEWVGRWEQESAQLTIDAAGPQSIRVKGEAQKGANTGDFEATYKLSGPLATPPKAPEGGCEVTLRLFNNALLAHNPKGCGGMGVGFGGLFHRGAKK
jgi:hypothetical protein